MAKSITVRIDESKVQEVDYLAATMKRDRSYLINEALDDYLEVQRWQTEGIKQAIIEAEAGQFATDEEVRAAFETFKKPLAS